MGSAPDYRVVLGAEIRKLRKRLGITQRRLAERADLRLNYLVRVESGEATVSLASLRNIAKALDVRVRDLLVRI